MRGSESFVCNEIVTREIDRECRRAPRERYATTAVSIVMDQQFVAKSLCVNHETAGTIRSQSDNLANDTVACNFDGSKVTLRIEGESTPRRQQRCAGNHRATQKISS